MQGNISLDKKNGETTEEDRSALGTLEERIGHLLTRFQELRKEKEELTAALNTEREKAHRLEKKLELLSQDKEKVKTRIDQLLLQLKGIDI
jgi:chromosome segregation ATPase